MGWKVFFRDSWSGLHAEVRRAPLNSVGVLIAAASLVISLREVLLGAASPAPGSNVPASAAAEDMIRWLLLIAATTFVLASIGGYVYRAKIVIGGLVIVALSILCAFVCGYVTYRVLGGFPIEAFAAHPKALDAEVAAQKDIRIATFDTGFMSGTIALLWAMSLIAVTASRVAELCRQFFVESQVNGLDIRAERESDTTEYSVWAVLLLIVLPGLGSTIAVASISSLVIEGLLLPLAR